MTGRIYYHSLITHSLTQVIAITDKTGHYKNGGVQLANFLEQLKRLDAVGIDAATAAHYVPTGPNKGYWIMPVRQVLIDRATVPFKMAATHAPLRDRCLLWDRQFVHAGKQVGRDALSNLRNDPCGMQPTTASDEEYADLADVRKMKKVPRSKRRRRRDAAVALSHSGALLPQMQHTVVSAAASAGDPVVDAGDPYEVVDAVVRVDPRDQL